MAWPPGVSQGVSQGGLFLCNLRVPATSARQAALAVYAHPHGHYLCLKSLTRIPAHLVFEPHGLRVVQASKGLAHPHGQARVGGVEVTLGAEHGKPAAGVVLGPRRVGAAAANRTVAVVAPLRADVPSDAEGAAKRDGQA